MMPENLLVAIDGTGSRDWRRGDGLNSHIYRFYVDFDAPKTNKCYFHGANVWHATGVTDSGPIADDATAFLGGRLHELFMNNVRQSDVNIFIVGHSRGCWSALMVAQNLWDSQTMVHYLPECISPETSWVARFQVAFLGLYDTIARGLGSASLTVPNARLISHVRRSSFHSSRSQFGRSLDVAHAHDYWVDTSHGGVGGDPGWFEARDSLSADLYCNALQVVMSDNELIQYGEDQVNQAPLMRVPPDYSDGSAGSHWQPSRPPIHLPRFPPLVGEERQHRIDRLSIYLRDSREADTKIRDDACVAGALFNTTSPFLPYGDSDLHAELWRRLSGLLPSP